MSSINIINNNTLDRPNTFKKRFELLDDLPLDLYNKLYLNKSYKNDEKKDNNNYNNLGIYIPISNNNIEYIDIKYIELNNKDNLNFYKKFDEKINNIHYISIYKVIIPKFLNINRELYNDNSLNDFFINNLNNIKKCNNYEYNNNIINIHNYQINNNNNIINYSINNNFNIDYEIIINNNNIINHFKYYVNTNINTQIKYPYINLSIENINDDYFNSTNEKMIYNNLIPNTKINYIYYHNNECDIIYPLSKLKNITNLKINLYNDKNDDLFKNINNYYDTLNVNCNCIYLNNKSGCSCSYIRDKKNYISTIILKLGIIKKDIINKIIK